jgi:hypothetical protein
MDDLVRDIFPVRRTIDDAVDQAEETSFACRTLTPKQGSVRH